MRGLGPFVNTVLCTVIGIVAGQGGVRLIYALFVVLSRTSLLFWITNYEVLVWIVGTAIWFIARGIVAAAASIASAYWFARRWSALGKWAIPATVSAVLSVTISLKWAVYEFSTIPRGFWP